MRNRSQPERVVTILFAEPASVYWTLTDDIYDKQRDARKWPGGNPIVAHPPCRSWCQLSLFAKPPPGERRLAIWAVLQARRWGGVIEHPAQSKLWPIMGLPRPGDPPDQYGGFTLPVDQFWWGHPARKRTFLYIVGCRISEIPRIPLRIGEAPMTIGNSTRCRKEVPKSQRSSTPMAFAEWLIACAERCQGTERSTHESHEA